MARKSLCCPHIAKYILGALNGCPTNHQQDDNGYSSPLIFITNFNLILLQKSELYHCYQHMVPCIINCRPGNVDMAGKMSDQFHGFK